MKRLTCDDPQDNFLTMMNYVFSKGGWACIRHDGENEDVPLTDWAKAQCAKCEYEISVGDTPQEIDETLCECLMGGEGCPVALAYCFACQAANLRDRLKAIEDILGEEYDLDQLRGWQQADQDGRLVVPPCKAGDTIYQLRDKRHARGAGISPRIVSYVGVWRQDYAAFHQGAVPCYKQDLGKTWFLTEKDAKVALEAAKTTKEEI